MDSAHLSHSMIQSLYPPYFLLGIWSCDLLFPMPLPFLSLAHTKHTTHHQNQKFITSFSRVLIQRVHSVGKISNIKPSASSLPDRKIPICATHLLLNISIPIGVFQRYRKRYLKEYHTAVILITDIQLLTSSPFFPSPVFHLDFFKDI